MSRFNALILQSGDEMPDDFVDCMYDESWIDCGVNPFFDLMGMPILTLLVGVPFLLGLWMQSESIAPPAIVVVLHLGLLAGGLHPGLALAISAGVTVAVALAYRSILGRVGR